MDLLDKLFGCQAALDDLACLCHRAVQGVDNDDTALGGVFVKMPVARLVRPHGLVHHLEGNLQHVWRVAADGDNEPALAAAFAVGEKSMVKQRLSAGRAAEDNIGGSDLLLEQAVELAVPGREDAELGVLPALALLDGCGDGMQPLEDVLARVRETAVDHVDLADGRAAQHERQPDVPVGLLARAKRRHRVDAVAPHHEAGGREGGPERRQRGGMQDADRLARLGEESDGADGFDLGLPSRFILF